MTILKNILNIAAILDVMLFVLGADSIADNALAGDCFSIMWILSVFAILLYGAHLTSKNTENA